ncbi:MAG: hypothetical protein ACWGQW_21095, partial [bacterium]
EEPILSSDGDPESIIQDLPATKLTETIFSEESTVPSESVDTPSDVTEALTEGIGVTEAIDESLPESEPDKPEGIVESEQEDQPADESLSEELILSEATPLEDLFTDETILQGDEQESLAWLEELSDTGESSDIITDTPDDLKDTSLESVEGETTISGLDDSHAAQMKEIIMPEEEKFDQEPEPAPLESTSAEGEQEIPDWLQEIEASGDEEISEDLEPAEIPDWLRELAPTSGMEQEDAIPKMAEPIAETPSVPEILPEDIHEEIALEPELDEKSPEIHPGVVAAGAAVSKSSDSISEWLESLDEGKLQEPEPIMEVDLFDEVDTTLAAAALEEQESIYKKSEPVVTDAVPPFILDESEGDEPVLEIEEPATTADDTKPSIVTISKLQTEMDEPTPQVDGSPDEIIAETEVSIPEAEDVIPEALQVDESESDEIPTWLADLAEESEGDVDDQPAELTDEMPDWLRELAPESDDAGKETAGEIETPIVEPAQEITEEVTDDSRIP